MIRLALIGRNISHSRSPELYKKILHLPHSYDLLDISQEADLPSIDHLASHYHGINITAPWKPHFQRYCIPSMNAWGAVNSLRFNGNICEATNTDVIALKELIPKMHSTYAPKFWMILGDGVMAKVVCRILGDLKIEHHAFSRRSGDNMLDPLPSDLMAKSGTKIVVNCCAREYSFTGKIDQSTVFWDLNYAHELHETSLPKRCLAYIDGSELLEIQAKHAVKFWEIH